MISARGVVRGGEERLKLIALNRSDAAAIDNQFLLLKNRFGEAVKDHSAL